MVFGDNENIKGIFSREGLHCLEEDHPIILEAKLQIGSLP